MVITPSEDPKTRRRKLKQNIQSFGSVNPVLREGNSDREHLKLLKTLQSTSSFDGAYLLIQKQK
jgi:monomeric isocitrate dehydrogenase